jgi:hypothetical protein
MSLPADRQNQANAKYLPACESVGQSPLEQFKSSLLRPLCFAFSNNQSRSLHAGHFHLPDRPCSNHNHPKNRHTRLDAKLPTHSDRQWPEVQFSILVANLLSQKTVSPDNWITIYSYAWRKSKPTSFGEITG